MENGAELGSGAENGGVSETFSPADGTGNYAGALNSTGDDSGEFGSDSGALEESFGRDPDAVPMPGADSLETSPMDMPAETTQINHSVATLQPVDRKDKGLPQQLRGFFQQYRHEVLTCFVAAVAVAFFATVVLLRRRNKRYQPRHK